VGSGEGEVHNMMSGRDAGQLTIQANKTLSIAGTMSLSGHDTLTSEPPDATSSRSYKKAYRVQQTFYRAGRSRQSSEVTIAFISAQKGIM